MKNIRKSPRADWITYDGGLFFITVCTKNRYHYFGKIVDGEMMLSDIGMILQQELEHPDMHHLTVNIPLFVVMPNHFHAIIDCNCSDDRGNQPIEQRIPNPMLRPNPDMARHVPTLSRYMASLKSAVSREAHKINPAFAWQARYHDHLIRNDRECNMISEYIINNPINWHKDCFANP